MKKRILSVAMAIVFFDVMAPFIAAQGRLESPRLEVLRAELEKGRLAALDSFWQEISSQGTPLIEPAEGDAKQMLVTFLWRAKEPVSNVVVRGAFFSDPSKNIMERMLDTDLWFKTFHLPKGLRGVYGFLPNSPLPPTTSIPYQSDPCNPKALVFAKDPDNPYSRERSVSLLEMPDAAPQPYFKPRPGVSAGHVILHRFKSAILKDERRVWIYTPPGYKTDGDGYGLLIVFDGFMYLTIVPTPTILDNLLAEKRIPPLVAVLVDNPSPEARRQLDNYPPFAEFVASELLPWLRANVHITHEATRTTLAGSSGGGQAAMCISLRHPELFGSVLSQSGSFFDTPDTYGDEWVFRQFVTRPKLPLRFYLDVGRYEGHEGVICSRSMRNVLEAKGYPVTYAEFDGGHDYSWWRGTLADGLIALYGEHK